MTAAFSPRVAVVGGGLGGLVIARQLNLKSPGHEVDVEVFEASPRVGGVIESSTSDGFIREHAVNGVIGRAGGGLADLASELDVEMITAQPASKKRWIYFDGKLREVPSSPGGLAKTDLLTVRGRLRLLAEPVRKSLQGEPTVAEFFTHRLGAEVQDRIVAPFVSGIYAGDPTELSMAAAFPKVSAIAASGSLVRGLFGAALGGRKQAGGPSKRETSAPALGMESIISRLAEKLSGRIRLEEPVEKIFRSPGGVDIVTAAGRVEHFDAVVCAVPSHIASRLLVDADAELAELLAIIPSAPVAVVHLGFERRHIEHPLDGFGFLVAPSENAEILGAVFESTIWPNRAPKDCELIRVMIGGRQRPEMLGRSEEELGRCATDALTGLLGVGGKPIHQHVVKWPHAISQYTIGHRERLERAEELATSQGVVLAGASYHGVAANAVAEDAVRAARNVHQLLAAPLVLAFALGLASSASLACSGSEKNRVDDSARRDGGATEAGSHAGKSDAQAVAAPAAAFGSNYKVVTLDANVGRLTIKVTATAPSSASVTPRLVAGCDALARPKLFVDSLGGVVGAFVWLEDVRTGTGATTPPKGRLSLGRNDCGLSPPQVVVARIDGGIELTTERESRQQLTITRVDVGGIEVGKISKNAPLETLNLAPIGRLFWLPIAEPGIYQVSSENKESAHVLVHDTPYATITEANGEAAFARLPPGGYRVVVWHPAISGNSNKREVDVDLKASERKTVEVRLLEAGSQ